MSELLRSLSTRAKWLANVADSVYVTAVKPGAWRELNDEVSTTLGNDEMK
jgi:hypothetical protein